MSLLLQRHALCQAVRGADGGRPPAHPAVRARCYGPLGPLAVVGQAQLHSRRRSSPTPRRPTGLCASFAINDRRRNGSSAAAAEFGPRQLRHIASMAEAMLCDAEAPLNLGDPVTSNHRRASQARPLGSFLHWRLAACKIDGCRRKARLRSLVHPQHQKISPLESASPSESTASSRAPKRRAKRCAALHDAVRGGPARHDQCRARRPAPPNLVKPGTGSRAEFAALTPSWRATANGRGPAATHPSGCSSRRSLVAVLCRCGSAWPQTEQRSIVMHPVDGTTLPLMLPKPGASHKHAPACLASL